MHARMLSVVVFSAERLQAASTAAGGSDGRRRIQPNSAQPSSGSIFQFEEKLSLLSYYSTAVVVIRSRLEERGLLRAVAEERGLLRAVALRERVS